MFSAGLQDSILCWVGVVGSVVMGLVTDRDCSKLVLLVLNYQKDNSLSIGI